MSFRNDPDLLNWLQDEQVDTIYMDDGRIIDVKSGNLRQAIREAAARADAEAEAAEEREEREIEARDDRETGADRCPPRE